MECGQSKLGCRATRSGCGRKDLEAKADRRRAIAVLDAGGRALSNPVRLAAQETLVFFARASHEGGLRLVEQFRRLVQQIEGALEQPAFEPGCARGPHSL